MLETKKLIQDILFYVFLIVTLTILVLITYNNSNDKKEPETYGVHIKGGVVAPGYYELKEGSRYKDVLLMAGGETEDADLNQVNLATKVLDGEEIVIPTNSETNSDNSGKININTADLYQLCKLDGIGEVTAQNIIDYRGENGPFTDIIDIKNVKGIGDAKFNNVKDFITV